MIGGKRGDLEEGGALWGLGAVVQDGAPLQGHQALNAGISRQAPAPHTHTHTHTLTHVGSCVGLTTALLM